MGKISKVWQHFDKVNKLTAKCKICQKLCPTAGNTSNLHFNSHLKNIHSLPKTLKISSSNVYDISDADDPGCRSEVSFILKYFSH